MAEATEWATAHEDDRIKYFLHYHAPKSLKSTIEKLYLEDIKQFKRLVQAIWSHQSDGHQVIDPPVYFSRNNLGHQRHNRRRNNGHDKYVKQS